MLKSRLMFKRTPRTGIILNKHRGNVCQGSCMSKELKELINEGSDSVQQQSIVEFCCSGYQADSTVIGGFGQVTFNCYRNYPTCGWAGWLAGWASHF